MASKHEPVELGNIERGEFVRGIGQAVQDAEKKLLEHVSEHGENAKSGVVVKIDMAYSKESGAVSLLTDIEVKPPKQPSRKKLTMAFIEENTDGTGACLFTQAGGTGEGNPHQEPIRDAAGDPIGS